MTEKQRENIDNMFKKDNNIDPRQAEREERKKAREREKRIREKKQAIQNNYRFNNETETVIKMTNRKNQKIKTEKQQKIEKEQKRIKNRKKRMKRILKWTSVLAIIIGGIVFALVSPIFNIQEIKVVNNELINEETIKSLSELSVGENLFRFNKQKISKNIKSNPYIENVKIQRILPNKIKIDVKERKREFNIEFLNGYIYINKQGYILEISNEKLDKPIIQGVSIQDENVEVGSRLNSEDLEKLEDVIQIIDICKNYELDTKVTSIDVTDKNEYSIYIETEKKTIYIGDNTNLSTKMLYIQAILEKNQGKEGYIYVNGDVNNNFKPRFREKV